MAAPGQPNISEDIEKVLNNDPEKTVFNHEDYSAELDEDQWEALADALAHNTTVTELLLDNANLETVHAILLAKALETNKCLKLCDVKYNKLTVPAFEAFAEMLNKNDTLEVLKIDFQKVMCGPEVERKFAAAFDVNTTLLELRLRVKEKAAETAVINGEVRNKQIAKRKEAGKDWADLDPARRDEVAAAKAAEREAARRAEAEEKAPVAVKVASTGGPYKYKELTALIEFQPDDVDKKKKEQYLSDEEFVQLFGATKAEFEGWPKWKKKSTKKKLNLH